MGHFIKGLCKIHDDYICLNILVVDCEMCSKIENSCVSQEREGLNPCCKSYKMLLFSRCDIILLEMMCSRSLQHIHVKDIGQLSDFLNSIKRIGEINTLHSLSILLRFFSGPAALCGFRFFNNLFMPVSVTLMFCTSRCGLCPLSGI